MLACVSGTGILPTKSDAPRHKGKVERGVAYVQENALKGKRFSSLQGENDYLLNWERSIADNRDDSLTGGLVAAVGRRFVVKFGHRAAPSSIRNPIYGFVTDFWAALPGEGRHAK